MSTDTPPKRDHLLSDVQYYILNGLASIVFPAVGTLYFALAQIWGLPYPEQIIGSIVAFDAFLGVLGKVGEASYNKSQSRFDGSLNISDQPDKTVFSLDLNHDPDELRAKKRVVFKVNTPREIESHSRAEHSI